MLRLISTLLTAMCVLASHAAATETLFQKLLRVAGLTATPAQMRGPGDDIGSGDIWVVNLGGTPVAWTSGGGYNSPIFSPDGSLLALKGDAVVRIPAGGGTGIEVQKISGALKLVGFDGKNPDDVIVLLESGSTSPLAVLSLANGALIPLPYDAKSEEQRRMLVQIRGQQRVYGDATVYIKTESKQGLSRLIEWTDVYLQRGAAAPQNVSVCDGADCGQPARSPDGRKVAFVKTGR